MDYYFYLVIEMQMIFRNVNVILAYYVSGTYSFFFFFSFFFCTIIMCLKPVVFA